MSSRKWFVRLVARLSRCRPPIFRKSPASGITTARSAARRCVLFSVRTKKALRPKRTGWGSRFDGKFRARTAAVTWPTPKHHDLKIRCSRVVDEGNQCTAIEIGEPRRAHAVLCFFRTSQSVAVGVRQRLAPDLGGRLCADIAIHGRTPETTCFAILALRCRMRQSLRCPSGRKRGPTLQSGCLLQPTLDQCVVNPIFFVNVQPACVRVFAASGRNRIKR